ncbi:MAG TPA: hypothetical protein VGX68_24855 [Thermoanaerobaculia bacterium]|jgi:hypothetical protein|nr:hypothetical protein [Thermoanaerobaculia bacterium]
MAKVAKIEQQVRELSPEELAEFRGAGWFLWFWIGTHADYDNLIS